MTDLATQDEQAVGPRYGRFLGLAALCAGGIAALGWMPTVRLAGDGGVVAMLAAIAVAFVASLIGTLPIVLARHKPPVEAMPAQLGAMAIRLVAVLLLAAAVALGAGLPLQPFLIWVAIAHAALLVADTHFARSFVLS
ncbi:MAG: hypothetical protein AAGC60_22480 [Acidobacteriota bacterium]